MVGADLQSILSGFLNLALLAGAAFYAGLVLTSYRNDGPQLRPRFDRRNAAESAEHLAVWPGVLALTLAVRVWTPIFEMLAEASAEVGEWFLSRRHHQTQ